MLWTVADDLPAGDEKIHYQTKVHWSIQMSQCMLDTQLRLNCKEYDITDVKCMYRQSPVRESLAGKGPTANYKYAYGRGKY